MKEIEKVPAHTVTVDVPTTFVITLTNEEAKELTISLRQVIMTEGISANATTAELFRMLSNRNM